MLAFFSAFTQDDNAFARCNDIGIVKEIPALVDIEGDTIADFLSHRALPGTKECPHCSRQGGGTAKQFLSMLTPYKKQLSIIFVVMACAAVTTLLNPEIQCEYAFLATCFN